MIFEEHEYLDEEKFRVVVADLQSKGWKLHRTNGSHHIFKHPKSDETIIVPHHGSKEISPGVLTKIKRRSTMFREDVGVGAMGTTSGIPANNTDSTGEAEIASNPPVFRKKKKLEFGLISRRSPVGPQPLRTLLSKDRRADRK